MLPLLLQFRSWNGYWKVDSAVICSLRRRNGILRFSLPLHKMNWGREHFIHFKEKSILSVWNAIVLLDLLLFIFSTIELWTKCTYSRLCCLPHSPGSDLCNSSARRAVQPCWNASSAEETIRLCFPHASFLVLLSPAVHEWISQLCPTSRQLVSLSPLAHFKRVWNSLFVSAIYWISWFQKEITCCQSPRCLLQQIIHFH